MKIDLWDPESGKVSGTIVRESFGRTAAKPDGGFWMLIQSSPSRHIKLADPPEHTPVHFLVNSRTPTDRCLFSLRHDPGYRSKGGKPEFEINRAESHLEIEPAHGVGCGLEGLGTGD